VRTGYARGAQDGRSRHKRTAWLSQIDPTMRCQMGGTGLEPVTPSLSSPQSCYVSLAGTPSLSRLCRNLRTLPACGVRKFDPPRNRRRRGRCGRYSARAPLGSSRHMSVESITKAFADPVDEPEEVIAIEAAA
jgi:hypothetical protein